MDPLSSAGESELTLALRLGVAVLCGMAVGLEREWSGQLSGANARFAGLRTLSLLGLIGGAAGVLAMAGLVLPGSALLVGAAGLVVTAYAVTALRPEASRSATTEAAALVVITLGLLAGLGHLRLAAGGAAIVSLTLSEKARLHGWARHLGEAELLGAFRFAVLALVVLPLLPAEPVPGLGGVRPRALWIIVLLFSALNYVGYLARRWVGPTRGYGITGILGGLVSSTAVTFHFSRESRRQPDLSPSLGFGVIGSSTVLVPRVLFLSAVLNVTVARDLLVYLAIPLLASAVLILLTVRRSGPAGPETAIDVGESPLGLKSALQMAIIFQVVLVAMDWVSTLGGEGGVVTSAGIIGLTNMNALTLAMTRADSSTVDAALGAKAIAVGLLTNTVFRLGLTAVLGSPSFRRVAGAGLALLTAASAGGLWLGWRF